MIEWPEEAALTAPAKTNIDRFRKSAGAKALEEDAHTWQLLAWARTEDFPHRILVRNEAHEELAFTFEGTGTWAVKRKPAP